MVCVFCGEKENEFVDRPVRNYGQSSILIEHMVNVHKEIDQKKQRKKEKKQKCYGLNKQQSFNQNPVRRMAFVGFTNVT